ncbi:hypothetical protein U9M48_026598 [Paspalum notatum var. saurae]|uniref:MADS-box domain-containing protein n=1 Tax=Paspalum notatum var. saurae TaxID=547442 RepID=A0AAQ3TT10_PASNO
MGRPPSKGRQRIEIRFIEDSNKREVTFSKRKSGLQKKVSELSLLSGAHVALVVFSPGGRAFALGTPSVDHVLRRYAPLPGDDDDDGLITVLRDSDAVVADRAEVEGIARRTEETKKRLAAEKTRMDAVAEKVRQATAGAGRKCWWEADVDALGEAELPEFARALRRLRNNVQRHLDSILASA